MAKGGWSGGEAVTRPVRDENRWCAAAESDERSRALTRTVGDRAAAVRAAVVPDWLAEVVRPKRAPVPWPEMIRAVLAICVPLSASLALGQGTLGVLPAMGGLLGTMADTGGPYLSRVKRVGSAALGGAAGLAIGSVVHGQGWPAVVALVVVAGVSGVLSAVGDIGSAAGLQLLVYTSLGIGPVGALRPVWHTAAGFLAGVVWALILILPSWLRSPQGREQRAVAAAYDALAELLRAVGGDQYTARRHALTSALNTAYDELLTARSTATGRSRPRARLAAALNASHLIAEAAVTLGVAGTRPPPLVIQTVSRLGGAIRNGTPPPMIPPPWGDSPATLTLRDAMVGAARALARDWSPEDHARTGLRDRLRAVAPPASLGSLGSLGAGRLRERAGRLLDEFGGGRLSRIFTLRLMACMGVAGLVSEVLPLQRSYWVPLTVAIVLKPDYGSVFARALQRGIGTVAGAVAGAALLVLVHGTWLLIPFAVLAALLPYGRSRNYGLLATFLTPLVVVLIDLLSPAGWRLAEDRLIDTLIGCAIVLLIGYAPWPASWYAYLPRQFAQTALDVRRYMEEALLGPSGSPGSEPAVASTPPARSRLRRSTYRALADLRAEFQRTMSEPPSVSRRAATWWPAVVALEQVMDAVTATAVDVSRGAAVSQAGVRQLSEALRAVSEAASTGTALTAAPEWPDDETLKPVTEAVRALLGVLGTGRAGRIRTGDLRDPNAAR